MDMYSNGLTRYNNLLNQFNNPNLSQEDLEAFKIGQSLGNIGKNLVSSFNDTTKKPDGKDIELTDGMPNGEAYVAGPETVDAEKLKELALLAKNGNL